MRVPYPPNPNPLPIGARSDAQLHQAWLDEIDDHSYRGHGDWEYESAVECAQLAEELDLFRIQANADPEFYDLMYEWDCYLVQNDGIVPLEQCCHDGVLLPPEQRFLRLRHCPEHVRRGINFFFANCPVHIQHHQALRQYLLVRMARAECTGSPDWRPETAPPRSVYRDNTFFRPQLLKVRNYAR